MFTGKIENVFRELNGSAGTAFVKQQLNNERENLISFCFYWHYGTTAAKALKASSFERDWMAAKMETYRERLSAGTIRWRKEYVER